MLRGELARDKEVTERFLQEARAASAIGNPHIIDISDFGVLPDGATYFVMEYLGGVSLAKLMEDARPLPVPRIISIGKQIAQGLSAAHAAGIIHRDLKPDNVMLISRGTDKDFVKILDFGIAKVQTGDASRLTRAGAVFGTPHYMSPEQAAGATVKHTTDVYSLGCDALRNGCGQGAVRRRELHGHPHDAHVQGAGSDAGARARAAGDPPGLDAVVLKCLSKKAEQRYESMDALVADLEKLELGQLPDAVNEMMGRSGGFNVPADYFRSSKMPPTMPGEPVSRKRGPRSKWPLVAGVAGVATAVGLVVVILVKGTLTKADAPPVTKPDISHTVPTATTTTTTTATQPTTTVTATVVQKRFHPDFHPSERREDLRGVRRAQGLDGVARPRARSDRIEDVDRVTRWLRLADGDREGHRRQPRDRALARWRRSEAHGDDAPHGDDDVRWAWARPRSLRNARPEETLTALGQTREGRAVVRIAHVIDAAPGE